MQNFVVVQAVAADLADCRNVNAFDWFLVAGEKLVLAGEDRFFNRPTSQTAGTFGSVRL